MALVGTLRVSVDTELSTFFGDLVDAAQTRAGTSAMLYHLPPRTRVTAERTTNAVAQTVLLTMHPTGQLDKAVAGEDYPALSRSTREEDVYVVLVLDAQQVPPLLSTATAHRCPAHGSGTGPLGWYLDAVVDGVAEDACNSFVDHVSNGVSCAVHSETVSAVPPPSPGSLTASTATAAAAAAISAVHVHLSLIVVPNATVSLDGLNSTNVNITAKEAATLFAAAATWAAARQQSTAALAKDKSDCAASATLDLCATAAQPRQAVQMIAALANKVLKSRIAAVAAAAVAAVAGSAVQDAEALLPAASPAMADLKDVRPDTQRKCVPTDFHALYTSMLTEVSSFSDRKTIAAVTAFPTLCHLLEYVDGVVSEAERGGTAAVSAAGVFSTDYGEQRSWNVLNDAIVEALVTDYRAS